MLEMDVVRRSSGTWGRYRRELPPSQLALPASCCSFPTSVAEFDSCHPLVWQGSATSRLLPSHGVVILNHLIVRISPVSPLSFFLFSSLDGTRATPPPRTCIAMATHVLIAHTGQRHMVDAAQLTSCVPPAPPASLPACLSSPRLSGFLPSDAVCLQGR